MGEEERWMRRRTLRGAVGLAVVIPFGMTHG